MCNHHKREEAKIFEDHAVSTYQDSCLVGHVPMELSILFCQFIEKRNNQIFAEVAPCIYHVNGSKAYRNIFGRDR